MKVNDSLKMLLSFEGTPDLGYVCVLTQFDIADAKSGYGLNIKTSDLKAKVNTISTEIVVLIIGLYFAFALSSILTVSFVV